MAVPAAEAGPVSDFGQRVLSALVLAPVALAAVWSGGLVFAALVALAAGFMSQEWDRLAGGSGISGVTLFLFVLACLGLTLLDRPQEALGVLALGVLVLGAITRLKEREGAMSIFGLVYIGLPCMAVLWIRERPGAGLELVLWLLAVVWATDIAAYLVGRAIGGPKLAPRVSPGKTWSGLFGGLVAGTLAAAGVGALLFPDPEVRRVSALGLAMAAAAQAGDLLESGVKRRRGVKDTGSLIPGHGGVLDRLDGLMISTPLLAALVLFAEGSGALWQ